MYNRKPQGAQKRWTYKSNSPL